MIQILVKEMWWKENAIYEFQNSKCQKLKNGIKENHLNMVYLFTEILIISWHTEI